MATPGSASFVPASITFPVMTLSCAYTAEEIKTYNFDPHEVDQNSMLIEYGLCFDINEYLYFYV